MARSVHSNEYGLARAALVKIRRSAGLSQRALAARLRVPHTWVSKVETGERRIDVVEFKRFCEQCGADPVSVFASLSRKPVACQRERT